MWTCFRHTKVIHSKKIRKTTTETKKRWICMIGIGFAYNERSLRAPSIALTLPLVFFFFRIPSLWINKDKEGEREVEEDVSVSYLRVCERTGQDRRDLRTSIIRGRPMTDWLPIWKMCNEANNIEYIEENWHHFSSSRLSSSNSVIFFVEWDRRETIRDPLPNCVTLLLHHLRKRF